MIFLVLVQKLGRNVVAQDIRKEGGGGYETED